MPKNTLPPLAPTPLPPLRLCSEDAGVRRCMVFYILANRGGFCVSVYRFRMVLGMRLVIWLVVNNDDLAECIAFWTDYLFKLIYMYIGLISYGYIEFAWFYRESLTTHNSHLDCVL